MSETQRTLVLIKPDGVKRGLVGGIISRFESRGLELVGMKLIRIDEDLAKRHYGAHSEKTFFSGLVEFITSGPVVAVVLEGRFAIDVVRQSMGSTDPLKAAPGTIRADFAVDIGENLVHGSDSTEAANHEISIFFKTAELLN
jgi:nucleoside-diphosphate kinase